LVHNRNSGLSKQLFFPASTAFPETLIIITVPARRDERSNR
jgi:hypothetical protein